MASTTLAATLLIGFGLGLRHALDVDHVTAVSTLVSRERQWGRSARIGAVWGLGHTATLLLMGLLVIVLGVRVPESWSIWLQGAVAAMLIFLGVRALWQWRRGDAHVCTHQHDDGHTHAHFHKKDEHARANESRLGWARGSFAVGMVHGLSGSAELMLLVLATIRQPMWGLAYIASFGAGMMLAMLALTAIFSLALRASAQRGGGWQHFDGGVRALTGMASLGLGIYLLWHGVFA